MLWIRTRRKCFAVNAHCLLTFFLVFIHVALLRHDSMWYLNEKIMICYRFLFLLHQKLYWFGSHRWGSRVLDFGWSLMKFTQTWMGGWAVHVDIAQLSVCWSIREGGAADQLALALYCIYVGHWCGRPSVLVRVCPCLWRASVCLCARFQGY